jgi:hypothetical protein
MSPAGKSFLSTRPKRMAWLAKKLGVELQAELERFRSPPN